MLKERITCQAEVIALSGNTTATVRLDVLLPPSVWASHHRWHESAAAAHLFAHLVPPHLPPELGEAAAAETAESGAATPRQLQQEDEEEAEAASYVQQLRRGLPDLRPLREGADPFT